MELLLKRIKKSSYDELKNKVIEEFQNDGILDIDEQILEINSENVIVNGKDITVNYNTDVYISIVNSDIPTYMKLAKIGMLLHKETRDINGSEIPNNVLYEKEVWAYLSFKVFKDVVKELRLDDDDKITPDKIERFFFNGKSNSRSGMDRTGLLFVWSMIDILESEDNEDMSITAFHFIDPVKAIYERTMSKNPLILKAFVQSIINNGKDSRIKNKKYKLKIPNNISCFSRINILDAYDYETLVNVISFQIEDILINM